MSRGIYDKVNKQRIPIAGAQLPNVDNALSSTSENPVQNKVIKQALDNKQDELTFDSVPTANSNNPVKSGGVYSALNNIHIDVDNALSSTSENPVQNKIIKQALDNKQNTLTFDNTPTANSNNPVKSSGIYTAITNLQSNFQAGCNTIVQAVTAKGQTPASNSPSDIATAISNISTGVDHLDILLGNVTINIENTLLKMTKSQFDTYKDQLIGKSVSVSNSQQNGSASMDWVIIGYNHDNTSYTFDLWASRAMFDSVQFGSSQMYNSSTAKTKIESAITGFSSELQAKLQNMTIVSNGSNLTSKIKLLSLTEMGISSGANIPGAEGNAYNKYFTTGRSVENTYSDLIRNNSSGSATYYWSRSRNTNGTSYVWSVHKRGYFERKNYTNSYALVPVIRIAVG